jgi:hypothetical protein
VLGLLDTVELPGSLKGIKNGSIKNRVGNN